MSFSLPVSPAENYDLGLPEAMSLVDWTKGPKPDHEKPKGAGSCKDSAAAAAAGKDKDDAAAAAAAFLAGLGKGDKQGKCAAAAKGGVGGGGGGDVNEDEIDLAKQAYRRAVANAAAAAPVAVYHIQQREGGYGVGYNDPLLRRTEAVRASVAPGEAGGYGGGTGERDSSSGSPLHRREKSASSMEEAGSGDRGRVGGGGGWAGGDEQEEGAVVMEGGGRREMFLSEGHMDRGVGGVVSGGSFNGYDRGDRMVTSYDRRVTSSYDRGGDGHGTGYSRGRRSTYYDDEYDQSYDRGGVMQRVSLEQQQQQQGGGVGGSSNSSNIRRYDDSEMGGGGVTLHDFREAFKGMRGTREALTIKYGARGQKAAQGRAMEEEEEEEDLDRGLAQGSSVRDSVVQREGGGGRVSPLGGRRHSGLDGGIRDSVVYRDRGGVSPRDEARGLEEGEEMRRGSMARRQREEYGDREVGGVGMPLSKASGGPSFSNSAAAYDRMQPDQDERRHYQQQQERQQQQQRHQQQQRQQQQEEEAGWGVSGGPNRIGQSSRHLGMMSTDSRGATAAAAAGAGGGGGGGPSRSFSQPEASLRSGRSPSAAGSVGGGGGGGHCPRVPRSEGGYRSRVSKGDCRSDAGDTASVCSDRSGSSKASKGKGKGILKGLGYMFKFDSSKV